MPSEVSTSSTEQALARMVEQLKRELSDARRREAATAAVLNVISCSNFELQPVFDAIVQSGLKLFSGAAITIAVPEGDLVKAVAVAEPDPARAAALWRRFPIPLTREYVNGVAILDRRLVDIPDVEKAPPELAAGARNVRDGGNRAIAVVPMMRGDVAIGAISVVRFAPGPLSDEQVAILKTFADQAVIAIENARLFAELKETLEFQTATSEVLSIISRSPAQVQPVLDAIVENAGRLCHAEYAFVYKLENERFYLVASNNAEAEHAKYIAHHPPNLDRGSVAGRAALDCATVHVADALADPQYTRRDSQRLGRYRSLLGVPLLRDGAPIGVLVLLRTKVAPFTDKQVELVTAFADQAVIATRNVGLFQEVATRTLELTQSLEYQTATGEVLNIIRRSPTQLQPVLDTIVETAARLCQAEYALIFRHIAEEVSKNGYFLTRTSKAVRDRCIEEGATIARASVNFILRGITFGSHRFGQSGDDSLTLAQAFFRNVLGLCDSAGLPLTDDERDILGQWIQGELPEERATALGSDAIPEPMPEPQPEPVAETAPQESEAEPQEVQA